MQTTFQVGQSEVHHVVVSYATWTSLIRVFVDDKEVYRYRNVFAFRYRVDLEIGESERHRLSLRFNMFNFRNQAFVDDRLIVGCLFPQLLGGLGLGTAFMGFFFTLFLLEIAAGFTIIGIILLALLLLVACWSLLAVS